MSEIHPKNALAGETSPYLLQHADNPVQWHPWGKIALEKARREDKPLLVSIGYSTCHWCHVMAHESFENAHTAALMNRYFVNIKVDREERPDLDKIYQMAHQFMTRRPGGWPLTLFLSPDDHTPFFAGTYFPDEARYGMPAFSEILMGVAEAYEKRRDDIREQNESVRSIFENIARGAPTSGPMTDKPLETARAQLRQDFDPENGGLGQAPKFPHPTSLDYLLRQSATPDDAPHGEDPGQEDLTMATFSLAKMADGGIRDQIGGGFYRYSVDEGWAIPHFEKMLYDNGLLLSLYADAWQLTGNPLFQRVALETGDWVMGEMQAPEGGYYSALDADSPKESGKSEDGKLEEGAFYLWSTSEAQNLLTEAEYRVAKLRFGLDGPPNFEGKWHLHIAADAERLARECMPDGEAGGETPARLLASARRKLFLARERRPHPRRDDKILTAWNALMIKGMTRAGRILGEGRFIQSAEKALAFIRGELWRDGRLLATGKDGRAHLPAYLDDYVFLMDAILELLRARWRSDDLDLALALGEVVLTNFQDRAGGGFYFTANDHEQLIHRPKPMMDDALPAGNGIAARVFTRLGHLLGEARYLQAAEGILRSGWQAMEAFPQAHTTLLSGLHEYLSPPQIIVLRGGGEALEKWHDRCQRHWAPGRLAFAIPADRDNLHPALQLRIPASGGPASGGTDRVVAYLCEGHQCQEPITDFEVLDGILQQGER